MTFIKYETMDELVRAYMSLKTGKYEGDMSEQAATTVVDLLETLEALLNEGYDLNQITVRRIVDRSGYSRTTFYKYFYDVRNMLEVLEEMLIFHTEENYAAYLQMFRNELTADNKAKLKETMFYFYPYGHICFAHNPNFFDRTRDIIIDIFRTWITENCKDEDYLEFYNSVYSKMYVDTFLFLMQHPKSKIWDTFFADSTRLMEMIKTEPDE